VVARGLFAEAAYDAHPAHPAHDAAPDGARASADARAPGRAGAPQQIVVVHRWARERLAATGER
jgi:hypothetical protein